MSERIKISIYLDEEGRLVEVVAPDDMLVNDFTRGLVKSLYPSPDLQSEPESWQLVSVGDGRALEPLVSLKSEGVKEGYSFLLSRRSTHGIPPERSDNMGAKTTPEPNTRRRSKSLIKRDVESAKYKEQIRRIERQAQIAAWNDYIGFGVSKVLGAAGLVVGGLEALDPALLPINLTRPEVVAGIGLALLTGKGVVTFIAKLEKSLGGK